jgi:hypothetical protein
MDEVMIAQIAPSGLDLGRRQLTRNSELRDKYWLVAMLTPLAHEREKSHGPIPGSPSLTQGTPSSDILLHLVQATQPSLGSAALLCCGTSGVAY